MIGFIENGGDNCKCADCWKVYCDEKEAKKTFARLKKMSGNVFPSLDEGKVSGNTVAA